MFLFFSLAGIAHHPLLPDPRVNLIRRTSLRRENAILRRKDRREADLLNAVDDSKRVDPQVFEWRGFLPGRDAKFTLDAKTLGCIKN